ncbi:transmembrane protein 116 isoform X2 [Stigmatopora argus]
MAGDPNGSHRRMQLASGALPWIHVGVSFISALGSASVLTWATRQWHLGGAASELRPLLLLAACDLLLSLCGLLGGALLGNQAGDRAWYALGAATQVACMMSFFYTLDYVWNAYARLRMDFTCVRHQLPARIAQRAVPSTDVTALLCGVLPPVLVVPVSARAAVDGCAAGRGHPDRCLPTLAGALPAAADTAVPACRLLRAYAAAVFLAAFFVALVGVVALVAKCRRLYRRVVTSGGYLGHRQRVSLRALDWRLLAHTLVLVACWAPTAYAVAAGVAGRRSDIFYVAQVGPSVYRVTVDALKALSVSAGRPWRRRRRASSVWPR